MSLPNLESAGWQPGVHWAAANPEQQHELDTRYRAEQLVDDTHRLEQATEGRPEDEPGDSLDREASIGQAVMLIQVGESYDNRPLADIIRDGLTWIREAHQEPDGHYHLRHTLEREAHSLLLRASSTEDAGDMDTQLLVLSTQWAAIEFFAYRTYRGWYVDEYTRESALQLIERAGITTEDFLKLYMEPINDESKRLSDEGEYSAEGANSLVIESRLLDRASELGVEVGKAHSYTSYLRVLGS